MYFVSIYIFGIDLQKFNFILTLPLAMSGISDGSKNKKKGWTCKLMYIKNNQPPQ